MSNKCQMVVFSNKAYNAIIRESFSKDPVETGGILLGHILDNGAWIVMEVLPPGVKSVYETAYFEYDAEFVNYLAQSVANEYKIPLELLGLWHRHPGSMDVFSSTDDGTNRTFALQNPSGVISGLVNIDPQFRLTMYHMDNPGNVNTRPNYKRIDVEVGDDVIPEEYFELKYYDGAGSNPNPVVDRGQTRVTPTVKIESTDRRTTNEDPLDIHRTIQKNLDETKEKKSSLINDYKEIWKLLKKNKIVNLIALILVIVSIFSIKMAIDPGKSQTSLKAVDVATAIDGKVAPPNENLVENTAPDSENLNQVMPESQNGSDEIQIKIQTYRNSGKGELKKGNETRMHLGDITWKSADPNIATVDNTGRITAIAKGTAVISVLYKGIECDSFELTVIE